MKLYAIVLTLVAIIAAVILPAIAADTEVDAELVLAVDVSRSMTPHELEIQRRGYATALTSKDVISAITSGFIGRIAVIYVEWAGDFSQRIIVNWSVISNKEEAETFSAKLTAKFNSSLRRTSISGAMDHSKALFDTNGFISNRQIIDISGDGPNNQGRPVLDARTETLAKGIVINGLPLMTREGMGSRYHLENLDEYYRNCVIGGPGSFVLPVTDWDQFPAAVRQKLILELAQIPVPKPFVTKATFLKIAEKDLIDSNFDCLIGEKMWNQMIEFWNEP